VKRYFVIAVAVFALASCGKKKDEPAATPTPAMGSGSAMMGSGPAAMGSGSAAMGSGSAAMAAKAPDVPTEQDFEKSAETSIDDKNVEAKVNAIEKDIGQ
jgi:hypothetical protein